MPIPVQSAIQGNASAASGSCTWPSATIAGNLLVAAVMVQGGSGETLTTPSGWTLIASVDNGTSLKAAMFYIENAASRSGAEAFSISPNATIIVSLAEYPNVVAALSLDGHASAVGASGSSDSGSLTTTNASDLLVACTAFSSGLTFAAQASPTNSFTIEQEAQKGSFNDLALLDRLVVATGSYDAGTSATPNHWAGIIAAFKSSPPPTTLSVTEVGLGTDQDALLDQLVEAAPGVDSSLVPIVSETMSLIELPLGSDSLATSGGTRGIVEPAPGDQIAISFRVLSVTEPSPPGADIVARASTGVATLFVLEGAPGGGSGGSADTLNAIGGAPLTNNPNPVLNAMAFNGAVVMAWEGLRGELWVSSNRGISGFLGVQGGWDPPTALVPPPVAPNVNTYNVIVVMFGAMGTCWVTVSGSFYWSASGPAVLTGRQSWKSTNFGKTWTPVGSSVTGSQVRGGAYIRGSTFNFSGAPSLAQSCDVGNGMSCGAYSTGVPELIQLRDNIGDAWVVSDVGYRSAGSPGFTGYAVSGRFVGVARCGAGWVMAWQDGSGLRTLYVDRYPTVFDWLNTPNTQAMDGVHFGGGERPIVYADLFNYPGGNLTEKGTDVTARPLQDGQRWMYAKTAFANTPRYLVAGGQLVAADASSTDNPILLGDAIGVGQLTTIEVDFTYNGADLARFDIRRDTGDGLSATHHQFVSAGYDKAANQWFILSQLEPGATLKTVTKDQVLTAGQTFHVLLRFSSAGAELFVDTVLILTLTFLPARSTIPPGINFAGLVMKHVAFPCHSSQVANFRVNGQPDPVVPTLTVAPQATTGATAYSYRVSAIKATGESLPCAAVAISNGVAALTSVNFNLLSWTAVDGATGYKVYGRGPQQLFMAAVGQGVLTYHDDGSATPAGVPPAATNFLPQYTDRFQQFIGAKDPEGRVCDTGQSWHYGTPLQVISGAAVSGNDFVNQGAEYVSSHDGNIGAPGILVSQPAVSPCQKVSIDVTVDLSHGSWALEVRARANNQPPPLDNYASFGYVFGGLPDRIYLIADHLLGTPITTPYTLIDGHTYNFRVEVDAVSVRGYIDNVLVLTNTDRLSQGPGFVGVAFYSDVTSLTKFRNFKATLGCGALAALPAPIVGLARAAESSLVGMFYQGGDNTALPATVGKLFLGWSGDRGRTWQTMSTPFITEDHIPGYVHNFPDCQKRLVPIEAGNVAVVWRDRIDDLPRHMISRTGGRSIEGKVASGSSGLMNFSNSGGSAYVPIL